MTLFFKDREYYNRRQNYLKLQKIARKKMCKASKEFCPWSGWYMHEMVKIMLGFYYETYTAGDCCWSTQERLDRIAESIKEALDYAYKLEELDYMSSKELLHHAYNDSGFVEYLAEWEKEFGQKYERDDLYAGLADEYFTQKYTKAMYEAIGKHIWEWCD
jgi:hypothetical protein